MPENCACTNFPAGLGNVTIGAALLVGTEAASGVFPLTLRGGDAVNNMFSSVILFKAANDVPLWQLGSGGYTGDQQEFSLYDQVNGVYRLFIGPTGNVGIGTVGPATRMHVYSPQAGGVPTQFYLSEYAPSVLLGNTTTASPSQGAVFALATAPGHYGLPAAGDALLATQGAAHGNLYIDANWLGGSTHVVLQPSTGNVGIGTPPASPPAYKLDVRGNSRVIGSDQFPLRLRGGAANIQFSSVIQFEATNAVPLWQLGSGSLHGDRQEFGLRDLVNGVFRLYVAPSGNVGVGSTAPQGKLHVGGSAVVDGNVGIGTTQPTQKLSVQGGIRLGDSATEAGVANALMIRRAGADSANYITMINENTVTGSLSSGGSGRRQDLVFANDAGGNYIFNTGRVGIGTTAPSERLHVNGNAIVEEDLTAKSSIRAGTPDRKIADGSGCYYA